MNPEKTPSEANGEIQSLSLPMDFPAEIDYASGLLMTSLRPLFILFLILAGFAPAAIQAAEFEANWQGDRRWTGPEHWAAPLYCWEVADDALLATAIKDGLLQRPTERIEDPTQGFRIRTRVSFLLEDKLSMPEKTHAGLVIGIQGMMKDPRHAAVWPKRQIDAVVRSDGYLVLGETVSEKPLASPPLSQGAEVELVLEGDGEKLTLRAKRGADTTSVVIVLPIEQQVGNIGLTAVSPRRWNDPRSPIRVRFTEWSGQGEGLVHDPSLAFGPILWTTYTRSGNATKLNVQMPPLGESDASEVTLEIDRNGEWQEVARAPIDPLSRTALLRADVGDGTVPYRVRYPWRGKDHFWNGTFAADPGAEAPLKVAAFSCDNGYAFPLPTLVRNVAIQEPDLLFFAGDQIYESYGGFGIVREPVEIAMLDYLRKYYQFGWTWRELLKNIPSIIIPDDHDVFQGNLWGHGGRKAEEFTDGGYVMDPEWVNAVQRTQTANLPDPVDPSPVEQGIGVYFTEWSWGGVPLVILEDRKWKSGPNGILPKNHRRTMKPTELDVEGAELLGPRQETFLRDWSTRTAAAPLRLVFSQTIFCRGSTHTGRELKPSSHDLDSNGWPQSGRRRALEPLRGNNTVMLAGDQHLGMLARQGIDQHGDGPWSFMVQGTANGFPRAWWPENGASTGDTTDAFGNKFTVLAVANPEKGSHTLKPTRIDDPEETAHRKGSGHGLLHIDPTRRKLRFENWRYLYDAAHPQPEDQFEGFPVEVDTGVE